MPKMQTPTTVTEIVQHIRRLEVMFESAFKPDNPSRRNALDRELRQADEAYAMAKPRTIAEAIAKARDVLSAARDNTTGAA